MSDRSKREDDPAVRGDDERFIQFDANAGSSVIGDDLVDLLSPSEEELEVD